MQQTVKLSQARLTMIGERVLLLSVQGKHLATAPQTRMQLWDVLIHKVHRTTEVMRPLASNQPYLNIMASSQTLLRQTLAIF
jgi:hypothetical protein